MSWVGMQPRVNVSHCKPELMIKERMSILDWGPLQKLVLHADPTKELNLVDLICISLVTIVIMQKIFLTPKI
jgi:hypothetical protein